MAENNSNELGPLIMFIKDKLDDRAQIVAAVGQNIFWGAAPQGVTAKLLIVYQTITGGDFNTVGRGNTRLFVRPLVRIKAISQGNDIRSAILASHEIDRALHGIENVVYTSEGRQYVFSCHREAPFEFQEFSQNLRWNHFGGDYRFFVQEQTV